MQSKEREVPRNYTVISKRTTAGRGFDATGVHTRVIVGRTSNGRTDTKHRKSDAPPSTGRKSHLILNDKTLMMSQ